MLRFGLGTFGWVSLTESASEQILATGPVDEQRSHRF